MPKKNPDVDAYLTRTSWAREFKKLRKILLDCDLTEAYKWNKPCYTLGDANIAILQGFKAKCAVMFPRGALMKDPHGVMEAPGKHSQAARRIPFADVKEVTALEPVVREYVGEAVALAKAGKKVSFTESKNLELVEELQTRLDKSAKLNKAFAALTPGRRRHYNLYIGGAKQAKTRVSRVDKCVPRILAGKGLRDD